MASISTHRMLFLVCAVLLVVGMRASAQDLQSPDWQILLDDFGYTDLVTVTFPGSTAHEVLTGDWSGAVKYDGVNTEDGETMLFPPFFFRPFFTTNSTFQVVAPMTTYHDPTNPVPGPNTGVSRILNEDLLVHIMVEMKHVPGGMAIGLNPGGVGALGPVSTSPYVMFQTYNITNMRSTAITNLSLYQLLHAHPNDDLSTENFACYDSKTYAMGGYRDYRYDITTYGSSLFSPEGSDLVGFSANTAPAAYAVGTYDADVSGIVADIYDDTLSGQNYCGPTNVAGAMKFHWPSLAPGATVSQTFAFWVAHWKNPPQPPADPIRLVQAYPGSSRGASGHQMGYGGISGDTVTAVPGVFRMIPGPNWRNFVAAAQMGVPYTLKNVSLVKETPSVIQCADVFTAQRIGQQGSSSIRTWWPLMYEIPGTMWTLTILYGTAEPWDDDGLGPKLPSYVHTEVWRWYVDATLDSMKDLLALFHELPFSTGEVPLISDEVLYPQLVSKLDDVTDACEEDNLPLAAALLGEFEMQVMDACIATAPRVPRPTGMGTGIANSMEHPACCKILADTEYVGTRLGAFTTIK